MNKRHYEHTLPNIRGSLSNTYGKGTPKEKKNALKNAYNWLKRFFGKAPGRDGAALEW